MKRRAIIRFRLRRARWRVHHWLHREYGFGVHGCRIDDPLGCFPRNICSLRCRLAWWLVRANNPYRDW